MNAGAIDDDWSTERVADRLQIADVLARYCRAIDRIQADHLIGAVFHEDALVDKTGTAIPVAQFAADVAARHPGVPAASHMVTNVLIDFLGAHSAFCESWCLALEQHGPAAGESQTMDRIYRVRYADRFERRGDGRWRIAQRTFVVDHVVSVPADVAADPLASGRIVGQRSAQDAVMRLRQELGLASV